MRVGDGDCKGVGLVFRWFPTGWQEGFDHHGDLVFIGMTNTDDGFFDFIGGVFRCFDAVDGGHGKQNSPRLPQFKGACGVFIDEGFFDSRRVWVPEHDEGG